MGKQRVAGSVRDEPHQVMVRRIAVEKPRAVIHEVTQRSACSQNSAGLLFHMGTSVWSG
ncbi:MAG TPA: hypothetical protein VFE06_10705 [Acidobacteriaceae bacterium]|jgi:hypothetical protein|nr:hypothetical protein [Acidobacteriaceae bacterium]